ncbi:MAG: 2'-5' RNA ligase family protein [Actinobacteria bacterium]|nr:2'-5' RNA ligase family protein [Actinomycetota bacterium]
MSPLPAKFTSRWGGQREAPSYADSVCWHILLGADPGVRAVVAEARQRLAPFGGFHMTPERWLHVTVLLAGPAADITPGQRSTMLARAGNALSGIAPVTVTLGRVFYHQQAIALGVSPAGALAPLLRAAQAATREVTGKGGAADDLGTAWIPHLTICYSTGEQPAAPVITALGTRLPAREVTISRLTLVVQNGAEDLWDWRIAGSVDLPGS